LVTWQAEVAGFDAVLGIGHGADRDGWLLAKDDAPVVRSCRH
jgi:hypothetical protein